MIWKDKTNNKSATKHRSSAQKRFEYMSNVFKIVIPAFMKAEERSGVHNLSQFPLTTRAANLHRCLDK